MDSSEAPFVCGGHRHDDRVEVRPIYDLGIVQGFEERLKAATPVTVGFESDLNREQQWLPRTRL